MPPPIGTKPPPVLPQPGAATAHTPEQASTPTLQRAGGQRALALDAQPPRPGLLGRIQQSYQSLKNYLPAVQMPGSSRLRGAAVAQQAPNLAGRALPAPPLAAEGPSIGAGMPDGGRYRLPVGEVQAVALAATSLGALADAPGGSLAVDRPQARQHAREAIATSDAARGTLKEAMQGALADCHGAAPDAATLASLRGMAELEFKRDADHAAVLKASVTLGLGLPPSPARTAFDANTTPEAAVWTAEVCENAFKTHTWFDFKEFRLQGANARFNIPGLAGQHQITDNVMWRLYQYRRHEVDGLVAKLHEEFPGKLLFSSSGSDGIESDLDITVASPGGGEDVAAMARFNAVIQDRFGRPPGRVFDTNLYARDYNAIKADNLTKHREGTAPVDHNIAEPEGAMRKMANIDQDVATLMKQRRFMDEASFTRMWQALQDSVPAGDRPAIRQRYEEGEAVYLLTAMEKVEAISEVVNLAMVDFDRDACAATYGDGRADAIDQAHGEFAQRWSEFTAAREAHASGAVALEDNAAALQSFQQLQDQFLGFLEVNFEDEVMTATDQIYAQRMASLRTDQSFIEQQEAELTRAGPDSPDAAAMGVALASAKARAKQAQFTNIIFANEAYVSQGAITHVVSGKQAGDAEVLARIQPAELMQSCNEQLADFLKDMSHMEHDVPAGDVGGDQGATRRQATGAAFVHATKYLSRMLDAVAMLESKYAAQYQGKGPEAEAVLAALTAPYAIAQQARGLAEPTPKALLAAVDGHLLKLRKSSTIPGEVKAEMALAETVALFDAPDIPTLRGKMIDFCSDFNRRVRSLDDFRQSQAVDIDTFRQYFNPGATATPPM